MDAEAYVDDEGHDEHDQHQLQLRVCDVAQQNFLQLETNNVLISEQLCTVFFFSDRVGARAYFGPSWHEQHQADGAFFQNHN